MVNQNTMENTEKLIRMLKRAELFARRSGINMAYIVDCGHSEELESTGTGEWTADAGESITSYGVHKMDDDERAVDELFEKLFDNEENLLQ